MGRPAERLPTAAEAAVLASLRISATCSFSDDNEEHVKLLERFWTLAHGEGEVPAFSRVCGAWTAFGFQRDDPVSDLRGGGMLALRNLVCFLEQQPSFALAIMRSREPSAGSFDPQAAGFYPFAAAGINVTRLLTDFAGLTAPSAKRASWPLLAHAFDECYALGIRLLDRVFDDRRASYMDFNVVLKEAGDQLRAALEACSDHEAVARRLRLAPADWGRTTPAASGVLFKLPTSAVLSSRKFAKWRPRYFALRGDSVAWFRPNAAGLFDKAEARGVLANGVRLSTGSVVRPSLSDATAFKIDGCETSNGRRSKLRLRAATPADAQRWMAAVHAVVVLRSRPGGGPPVVRTDDHDSVDLDRLAIDEGSAASSSRLASNPPDGSDRIPRRRSPADSDGAAVPSNDWISCSDDNRRVYYVHTRTGRTTWDLPPGWSSSSSGWSVRRDPKSDQPYFFRPSTGEVSWTPPPER